MRVRWCGALAVALVVAACGGRPETSPEAENAHVREKGGAVAALDPVAEGAAQGPWFVVDAAEDRRLDDRLIYHQGPRQPPAALRRGPVMLPIDPSEVRDRPLLVQVVVSDTGRVARARILRDPSLQSVRKDVLKQRVAAALRGFRFSPATLDDRPVAVYYDLSLPVTNEPLEPERSQ
jgi:hypothetical protein